jgi:hypothetical protein
MAGCKQSEPRPAPEGEAPSAKANSAAGTGGAGSGADLTGLFEGGEGPQRNQLCIVQEKDQARFGLVVWGSNQHSCSGTGVASRGGGGGLRLAMSGDSECVIQAEFSDGQIVMPDTLPQGCAYYCGARARMESVTFTRQGSSRADALKAKDLVGEALCGGG